MTKFVLCRLAIGQDNKKEIAKDEYEALDADMKILVELSDVEEKFSAFVDNYFELERGLLEESLRAMLYRDYSTTGLLGAKKRHQSTYHEHVDVGQTVP